MKNLMTIACLLVVWGMAVAWPTGGRPATTDNGANALTPNTHEISTEMSGVDSLEIIPDEIMTPNAGGVRRTVLEATVFHRQTPVIYDALNRRDPFHALLTDEKGKGDIDTDLLLMDGAVLKGVVWSEGQYLAIVKDKTGKTFFLREGDPIYQGHVRMVTQSQAVFEIADFGEYDQITLKVKV